MLNPCDLARASDGVETAACGEFDAGSCSPAAPRRRREVPADLGAARVHSRRHALVLDQVVQRMHRAGCKARPSGVEGSLQRDGIAEQGVGRRQRIDQQPGRGSDSAAKTRLKALATSAGLSAPSISIVC